MKVFMKFLTGLFSVVLLTGCLGEEYDFAPPSVTFVNSDVELVEANINWTSDENYVKESTDIISLAKDQPQVNVDSGEEDYIQFNNQDFAIEELTISVWQGEEEIQLELKDGQTFNFPSETGEYVVEVNLVSDKGTAQYVGNIAVQ